MESILQIFRGCHRDSYKITMFLRGIILENVHDIVEEVSLVCGATTSQSLIIYLYDPISLKEQFHRLGQIDIGIASVFAEEEQQRKNELTERQRSMSQDSFVQNVNDSFRSSDRESSAAKITIKEDYIGGVHFPFGDEIDSSTTELSLNQLRVIAMGKILFERTLQKIPGNSEKAIAETIGKFANYVMLFGNVPSTEEITNEQLSLRIHVFFFLHQLMFYITKADCVNNENSVERIEDVPSFGEAVRSPTRSRRPTGHLVQNAENYYLNHIIDIFMKSL